MDDEGQEVELHQEGNLAIRVAPARPVGLFTHYVVSTLNSTITGTEISDLQLLCEGSSHQLMLVIF